MSDKPLCPVCGLRPVHARGMCSACYRRAWRHANGESTRHYKPRADCEVRLLESVPDPELGVPLFRRGAVFEGQDWSATLEDGTWPDGSRWQIAGKVVTVRGRAFVRATD